MNHSETIDSEISCLGKLYAKCNHIDLKTHCVSYYWLWKCIIMSNTLYVDIIKQYGEISCIHFLLQVVIFVYLFSFISANIIQDQKIKSILMF